MKTRSRSRGEDEPAMAVGVDQADMEELDEAADNHHPPSIPERQISSTDFICHCCYQLLVMPSTLVCGHSFCRLCLAQWYDSSKRQECPVCRAQWQGCPKVNIVLRDLLQRTFPDEIRQREETVKDQKNEKVLADFEKLNQQVSLRHANRFGQIVQGQRNMAQLKDFCSGILVAAGVLTVVYLAWYWHTSDSDLLIYKPVQRWDTEEVAQWLTELGAWSEDYALKAVEHFIDGKQLVVMEEQDLVEKLEMTDSLHKKVVLRSLQELSDTGSKLPGNLWEYKSLHPGRSLLLLYGLKDYPRTTMLYVYLFEYDNIFIPFVQYTCLDSEDHHLAMFDNVTSGQFAEFVSKWASLPYYLIVVFAYDWTATHYWISRLVMVNCFALTCLECSHITWFFRGGYRQSVQLGKSYAKHMLSGLFFIIIWPVVPSVVCNVFFYAALYISPYVSLEKVYKRLKS